MRTSAHDGDIQTVRITAWTYAVYCTAVVPTLVLSGPALPGVARPTAVPVLLVSALFSAALLSVLRGRRLGYYCCFFLSIAILFGVPIGTILGWNMLRALRRSRSRLLR
jgi:hypothetical protein